MEMGTKDILDSEVVKETYKDAVQPSARKFGSILETLAGTLDSALLPLKKWNERQKINYNNYIKKLEEEVALIEPSKRIDIPLELLVPALDKLSYTSSSIISEMYLQLLTKGASQDTIALAHPGFIHTVSSLSVDEARILRYLFENGKRTIPFITIMVYSILDPDTETYRSTQRLTNLSKKYELDYPNNDVLYINNLMGLGILDQFEGRSLREDDAEFEDLEARFTQLKEDSLKDLIKERGLNSLHNSDFVRGYYYVTEYGQQFLKACNGS